MNDTASASDHPRLMAIAQEIGARLVARGETVAVAESSAGGLISAALLSVGGASRFFKGGAVVYTKDAKMNFLHLDEKTVTEPRASTEAHALVLARGARAILGSTWGIGETGATGPTGNRYGDAAGHSCMAVAGPAEAVITLETGSNDRQANMQAFAKTALNLLLENLSK